MSLKFIAYFLTSFRPSSQSGREPESRKYEEFWIPVCAGMTQKEHRLFHGSILLTMTLSKVERVIAFPRQDTRLKESNYEAEAA